MPHVARCADLIEATPRDIIDALLDFETYPQWQAGVLDTNVLERDEQGRGSLIELRVDAKVRKLRVVVRARYDEPDSVRCEYVGGDVKDYRACYSFAPRAHGTTFVTYEIAVEPGFPLPAALTKLIADRSVKDTVRALKTRVEGREGTAALGRLR
ncbi:type II toxin-antitoxin system RatA family toxin [Nocardia nova]|jgi:ribosome-associated toxin RatA of RatAB toxin-antitoxin module|uniref:type II toxin-antitoxin system RatA family toxin n=1 Tax=Nocardia nova TaxID=37330 RepID=UPI001895BFF3|nr:SRPBCC family protein [Nocardia nova]MBF6150063.1 SRPBCC family protein [Nocardia nova]